MGRRTFQAAGKGQRYEKAKIFEGSPNGLVRVTHSVKKEREKW